MLAYPFSDHRDSVGSFPTNQGGIDLNVFEAVKQSVTTRQAAEHYGIHVGRNGMACCPFHNDKTPSMKLDRRYHCFRILADYLHLLMAWRTDYAPHSPEEAFHPRFVEALQKQAHVEYLLDVLLFGETEEKAALITNYGKDVIQLEQRMAELAAADAARTKKHHERHAATPER